MKVSTFKIDDIWYFQVGKHVEKGFATKDEAQLMGEKFLVEQRKAEKARNSKKDDGEREGKKEEEQLEE